MPLRSTTSTPDEGESGLSARNIVEFRFNVYTAEDGMDGWAWLGFRWYCNPMEASIDSVGRIVVPKPLRDALGLTPGTVVDISQYGDGVQITPGGRTARLERDETGRLVARSDTVVTDEMTFALIDAGRR